MYLLTSVLREFRVSHVIAYKDATLRAAVPDAVPTVELLKLEGLI